ncbi:hypothetical protein FQV26_04535 [Planococcus sp. CPCC 101016]|uniref:DUF6241 domain-containing protein n=1 Tax=Planococcus sp. CPCC 101016 TaxID=2599617 RepID=UPI0011B5DB4E|nr:DUF6241 domain-containing protein [Planococcus sp. CPCC 101016]TWT07084.1 hypothetical protein FQV26_04535 [Planococcus sp. CPCC 101016]
MKSLFKTIAISFSVIALLAAGGYYFVMQHSSPNDEITSVAEEIESREVQDASDEESVTQASQATTGEADLEEWKLQVHLHQMTHQKVEAAKKIGAVEMTADNIENLLTIVEANENHYEHSDFYKSTLTAWQQGDFSNAVHVHNTIWEWHDGNVGRATGLMSAEQEQRFVEDTFR